MKQMNLGKRIRTLIKLPQGFHYDTVFDTCCDHGKIGLGILEEGLIKFNHLHFIDIVPHIISQLDIIIADIPKACASIKTQTLSFIDMDFKKTDLVIMAGVGSELILKAIKAHEERGLKPQHYLISSHTKHLGLRKELRKRGFTLVKEHLTQEADLFYDHLLVHKEKGDEIPLVNQSGTQRDLQEYYKNLARFLSLKARHGDKEALHNLNIISNLII